MSKTEKIRKIPTESVSMFSVGYTKKGNDGNMWKIIETSSSTYLFTKHITNKERAN